MTLDAAKLTALDHANRYRQRCYVVRVGDGYLALTRDEIESHGLAMAQSPSPVVGYFDASAATLENFIKAQ